MVSVPTRTIGWHLGIGTHEITRKDIARNEAGGSGSAPTLIQIWALLKSAFAICLFLSLTGFTSTTDNPAKAEIVTSDVSHFWQAFDDAAKVPAARRAAVYQREYFNQASQGLKDFLAYRHISLAHFTQHVETNRSYYAKVRPFIDGVMDQKARTQSAFRRLKALYPNIKLPTHVYFIVGPQHGAGMNSEHGIVMAAEMFATPPGTPYSYNRTYPRALPFIIVHETIHFNQSFQPGDRATLLEDVITEGTADFIASLALPEPAIRQYIDTWQYGCRHEATLDARFAADTEMKGTGPWMYTAHPDTGWPPDMGYWLGYRIDQSFYDQAHNKTQAIGALLGVTRFRAFLNASGYPVRKEPCRPERPESGKMGNASYVGKRPNSWDFKRTSTASKPRPEKHQGTS